MTVGYFGLVGLLVWAFSAFDLWANAEDCADLIVAANRTGVRVQIVNGAPEIEHGVGGLESVLGSLNKSMTWIGWPGGIYHEAEQRLVSRVLNSHKGPVRYEPVFMSQQDHDLFYLGFSNEVLWPLYHGRADLVRFDAQAFSRVQQVSRHYAEKLLHAIVQVIKKRGGSFQKPVKVWLNDYHMSFVASELRMRMRTLGLEERVSIGYFLHIPFPRLEDLQAALPTELVKNLLEGLFANDYLGVHTQESVRNLVEAGKVVGLEPWHRSHRVGHRQVKIEANPIGISPHKFRSLISAPETKKYQRLLKKQWAAREVILGLDRLDYSKNLLRKVLAFERFLEEHPDQLEKVLFYQVAVPNRVEIQAYQQERAELEKAVARINHRFFVQAGGREVIELRLRKTENINELVALYLESQNLWITSIADGMNVVAFEYASIQKNQKKRPGMIIMTDETGASRYLPGVIRSSAFDIQDLAAGLNRALQADRAERLSLMQSNQYFIEHNSAEAWASRIERRLENTRDFRAPKTLQDQDWIDLEQKLKASKIKLFAFDSDGNMADLVENAEQARVRPEAIGLLNRLSALPDSRVVVISGRSSGYLDREFPVEKVPNVLVVGDHGGVYREPGSKHWQSLFPDPVQKAAYIHRIQEVVQPIFEEWQAQHPGTRIEHKNSGLAWHFRGQQDRVHDHVERSLLQELRAKVQLGLGAQFPYRVKTGGLVIEVLFAADKGGFLNEYFDIQGFDFIYYSGDSLTDEEAFASLPIHAISVLTKHPDNHHDSLAKYQVDGVDGQIDVMRFLAERGVVNSRRVDASAPPVKSSAK